MLEARPGPLEALKSMPGLRPAYAGNSNTDFKVRCTYHPVDGRNLAPPYLSHRSKVSGEWDGSEMRAR
jgi:hypothetical protein